MFTLPPTHSVHELVHMLGGASVIVWCTPSVADRLQALLPWQVVTEVPVLGDHIEWLLAVGGGTLIDKAKILRAGHPHVKLAALPTLWGSGAEASPIAVINRDHKKVIKSGTAMLPDMVVLHPSFAESLPGELIKFACGDAWSHALEGFLSPLGSNESRADFATAMLQMLHQPLGYSESWFSLSAQASAGQAKTSVGVVHGVAHVLEGVLHWGHARLCSLYLLPVMSFNRANSPKWRLLGEYGLADDILFPVLRRLFDPQAYSVALPSLQANWMTVLRDPCTRTNSALVRRGDIEFFEAFEA